MATVEIDQRWIDELQHLSNGNELDLSTEIEAALRQHLFKLRQSKIDYERGFYEQNHAMMVEQYLGHYIAIHNHIVVDSGEDGHSLAKRMRNKLGRTPLAIILVEPTPEPPSMTLRGPRLGRPIK